MPHAGGAEAMKWFIVASLAFVTSLAGTAQAAQAQAPASAPACVPADASATDADDALPFKLSLPTEDDRTAWRGAGLRLQLGMVYGRLWGLSGVPSGRILGPIIRVGARLDDAWSVLASFQYASVSGDGGLSGLRFAGTIDPTWHVTDSLDLAIGFGFAGLVEGNTGRSEPDASGRATLVSSYTMPKSSPPIPSCVGVGAAGLLRASWLYVLGPIFSSGFSLEVDGQWTGCKDSLNRVEPDTAQPIYRVQWWPHMGATLAWVAAWR